MKEDEMLMCLIAFVLGYLVARMIRGNGLSVGGENEDNVCNNILEHQMRLFNDMNINMSERKDCDTLSISNDDRLDCLNNLMKDVFKKCFGAPDDDIERPL